MLEKKPLYRMCCGCRNMFLKTELIRAVKFKNKDIKIDITGKENGRGCYVCKNIYCLKKALKSRSFERNFKQKLPQEFYNNLEREII